MMLCGTHRCAKGSCHRQHHTTWIVSYLYIALYINSVVCWNFCIILFHSFFYSFSKTVCKLCLRIDFAVSIVDYSISIVVFCMDLWVLVYYRLSFLLKDNCIHFHPYILLLSYIYILFPMIRYELLLVECIRKSWTCIYSVKYCVLNTDLVKNNTSFRGLYLFSGNYSVDWIKLPSICNLQTHKYFLRMFSMWSYKVGK